MYNSFNDELANTNSLFDKEYFDNMNLNDDMEKIYSLVRNNEEYDEYEKEVNLSKLRIDNYKKYNKIKIDLIEKLPNYFYLDVKNIKKIYSKINSKKLLTANYSESEDNKYKLIEIYKAIDELKFKVEKEYKRINKENNKDQKLWNYKLFEDMNIDKEKLKEVLKYYDSLLMITSKLENNIFLDYKNELERKKYIDKIKEILDEEIRKLRKEAKEKELDLLNNKIEKEINEQNKKIDYLNKLMPENSLYKEDFSKFKILCKTVTNYNSKKIEEARETYKMICQNNKINIFITRFEKLFLYEVEKNIKGKKYEKLEKEIQEIKKVIHNVENNYYELLNKKEKKHIRNIKLDISSKIINVKKEQNYLNKLIKNIWSNYLTDIYEYNPNKDYKFICSNDKYVKSKYDAILITKEMIKNINEYNEYQIGFICNNNDNILCFSNKSEKSNQLLKLPKDIEKEFINFENSTKIILNGEKTNLIAVYFIDDGDFNKLNSAINLANTHNVQLILLKK